MRALALLLLATVPALADVVVLRDRTVLEGPAEAKDEAVSIGGRKVLRDELLLWEDGDGVAREIPPLTEHMNALRALAGRRTLGLCLKRLAQAVKKGDAQVAADLLERAEQEGLDPRESGAWAKRIDGLKPGGGSGLAVPGDEVLIELLVDRARKAIDAEQTRRGYELLRQALLRDAKNEPARELLDEVAPTRWRVGEPAKDDIQRVWLDWQIDVIEEGVRAVGRRQPDIQRARVFWQRKLHGVQSQEIVFVTPLTNSGIVGMCVKTARITCQALDRMFHTDKPKRLPEDFLPLVIYMYENRKEYMEKASAGSGAPPDRLQFSAGFYVRGENISRFFWPDNAPNPGESVRGTFVHELTHHWIERRNPRWHARDLSSNAERAQSPGFWIVEGMATFVEEGRYDFEHGVWSHFNPKANSLDVVAALSRDRKKIDEFNKDKPAKQQRVGLIPWKKQYALSQVQFNDGKSLRPTQLTAMIRKKWALRPFPTSEMRLFYEQAAATCHFLYWGEDGKYRDRLLDYVADFYTTKRDRMPIDVAFGVSPDELGAKVEAFAKAVMDGWRPE